ncbi:argininosuccinate lyase, partial [Bacteroidales bacterium MSK.15.36]|nr:argininosuccinate lyase [Bacteroidales bacterium MSK.15.36]
HIMAYYNMFKRDKKRIENSIEIMNESPLGCCALAGTTYETDREFTAKELGFRKDVDNFLDGVSDRDFVIELISNFSIIMMHLSRLSEELILWSSKEFDFVIISDEFSTGSSIMPQKKNPDAAELIRGKTGRVYGDLMGILTVMKGIPLAYNKDMQE